MTIQDCEPGRLYYLKNRFGCEYWGLCKLSSIDGSKFLAADGYFFIDMNIITDIEPVPTREEWHARRFDRD